jgi:hypothetical protein
VSIPTTEYRLRLEEGFEAEYAVFPPNAGLLVSTKRCQRIMWCTVDYHTAGLQSRGDRPRMDRIR